MNANARLGSVKVELVGLDGESLGGFSRDECDVLVQDDVRQVVTWKGSADLSALAGQEVKLRFLLKNADLYAFQFVEEEQA